MSDSQLLHIINQKFDSELQENEDWYDQLSAYIKDLLDYHFERLNWLLYRIDVDEKLLSATIHSSELPPHILITNAIIERCKEIASTRSSFNKGDADWSFDLD